MATVASQRTSDINVSGEPSITVEKAEVGELVNMGSSTWKVVEIAQGAVYESEQKTFMASEWTSDFTDNHAQFSPAPEALKVQNTSGKVLEEVAPALPAGWVWCSSWRVDKDGLEEQKVDADGWTYKAEFDSNPPVAGGNVSGMFSNYRQRKWIRIRARLNLLVDENADKEEPSLFSSLFGTSEPQPEEKNVKAASCMGCAPFLDDFLGTGKE